MTVFLHHLIIQWNLSVTTTSIIKYFTHDLFSNVFTWRLEVPMCSCWQYLPSGAHLGGPWPPRWAPEGREISQLSVRYRQVSLYWCLYRSYNASCMPFINPQAAPLIHASLTAWCDIDITWRQIFVFAEANRRKPIHNLTNRLFNFKF